MLVFALIMIGTTSAVSAIGKPKKLINTRQAFEPVEITGKLGDLDGDGDVDIYDWILFGLAYGSKIGDANYNPDADLDNDGDVDLVDFSIFSTVYGT